MSKVDTDPAESTLSHKSKVDSSPEPKAAPNQGQPKTEAPKEPEHVYHAFEASKVEPTPIGCDALILEYKLGGQLGVFYDRDKCTRYRTPIPMDAPRYHTAVAGVLRQALERLLYLRDQIDYNEIEHTYTRYANDLADGVMIATYTKLRTVTSLIPEEIQIFHKKPKAPLSFEIPSPYALAVSQLGQIRVSGLTQDNIYMPVMSQNDAARFGIPANRRWSPVNYARAVEYAKKLGMRFSYADLDTKIGSSWWLLRPTEIAGRFAFQCPLPEENFTPNMAVLATLFCYNDFGDPYNQIFDLAPLGNDNYGTMIRDPHDQIAVSTFFAIEGDPSLVWTVA